MPPACQHRAIWNAAVKVQTRQDVKGKELAWRARRRSAGFARARFIVQPSRFLRNSEADISLPRPAKAIKIPPNRFLVDPWGDHRPQA